MEESASGLLTIKLFLIINFNCHLVTYLLFVYQQVRYDELLLFSLASYFFLQSKQKQC